METKFKPGPWRLDTDNLNVYSDGMIAHVYGHDHNGERAGNAHLIAAAPEMHTVLADVLDALTDGGLRVLDQEQDFYHIGAIKRVLKKAGGE